MLYERNGRFYGDFRGYADVGGSREALAPHGTTRGTQDRVLAEQLYDERLKDLERRRTLGIKPRLLEDVVEEWWQARAGRISDTHMDAVIARLDVIRALPALRRKTLDEINAGTVRELMAQLKQLKPGMANSTYRGYFLALSAVMKYAAAVGYLERNPLTTAHPSVPYATGEERYCPPPGDVAKLIAHCRTVPPPERLPSLHLGLLIAAYTGARIGEISELRVRDIDLETGLIQMPASKQHLRHVRRRVTHRTVPLWRGLREVLEPLLPDRAPDERVLWNYMGKPATIKIWAATRRICLNAGIEPTFTAHALRHAYVSARLRMSVRVGSRYLPVSVRTVSDEVGHTTADLTEGRYSHVQLIAPLDELDYAALEGSRSARYARSR